MSNFFLVWARDIEAQPPGEWILAKNQDSTKDKNDGENSKEEEEEKELIKRAKEAEICPCIYPALKGPCARLWLDSFVCVKQEARRLEEEGTELMLTDDDEEELETDDEVDDAEASQLSRLCDAQVSALEKCVMQHPEFWMGIVEAMQTQEFQEWEQSRL